MLSAARPVFRPLPKYWWMLYFAVCLVWGIHEWGNPSLAGNVKYDYWGILFLTTTTEKSSA
jgi:hypothetical protein